MLQPQRLLRLLWQTLPVKQGQLLGHEVNSMMISRVTQAIILITKQRYSLSKQMGERKGKEHQASLALENQSQRSKPVIQRGDNSETGTARVRRQNREQERVVIIQMTYINQDTHFQENLLRHLHLYPVGLHPHPLCQSHLHFHLSLLFHLHQQSQLVGKKTMKFL